MGRAVPSSPPPPPGLLPRPQWSSDREGWAVGVDSVTVRGGGCYPSACAACVSCIREPSLPSNVQMKSGGRKEWQTVTWGSLKKENNPGRSRRQAAPRQLPHPCFVLATVAVKGLRHPRCQS